MDSSPPPSNHELTHAASRPIGTPFGLAELSAGDWAVVGAPVDLGSGGEAGARHGPEIIRACFPVALQASGSAEEFLDHELERVVSGLGVADLGDVSYVPGESLASFGRRLATVVARTLDSGRRVLTLGGDHSVTAFAVGAVGERIGRFGVLHLDAHSDLGQLELEEEGLNHANVMAFVLKVPSVHRVLQVGVRSVEPIPPTMRRLTCPVERVSALAVRRHGVERVLSQLDSSLPWYVSVDIDCLSPEVAPDTPCRVPGGLDYYDVLQILDFAASRLDVVAADIVEVMPSIGRLNLAGECAARFAWTLLAGPRREPS